MKRMLLLMLAGLLVGLFIYHMNRVALTPMEGLTVDGKTADTGVSGTSPENTFEPLDLSFLQNLFVRPAFAENVEKTAQKQTLSRLSPRSMGNPDAPVKMYVFSSLTCPHCSGLHTRVLKDIEDKYIKTGKILMTYIDFPADKRGLAGAMLTRCVKPEAYFPFLETLFANQNKWAFSNNAEEVITAYASLQGLSKADVRLCLGDQTLKNSLISTRDMYMKKYNITVTPTVVVTNDKTTEVVTGSNAKKINAALEKFLNETK